MFMGKKTDYYTFPITFNPNKHALEIFLATLPIRGVADISILLCSVNLVR